MSTTPITFASIRVPQLGDSPRYAAAAVTLDRLRLEVVRLEAERNDIQAQYERTKRHKDAAAHALLAGKPLAEVRPAGFYEAERERIERELSTTRRAVEIGEQRLAILANEVKGELAAAFAPAYRELLRAAAVAFLKSAPLLASLDQLNAELGSSGCYGRSDLDSPLPAFRPGSPSDPESHVNTIVRQLLDAQVIDARADAELLAPFRPSASARPVPIPSDSAAKQKRKGP